MPEEKLAERLLARRRLSPPIRVFDLAGVYATVEFAIIPLDIDGVCLDLKRPGFRPRIIVNKDRAPTRQRFTAAHELGHVLIPWHYGTIVDETTVLSGSDAPYWLLEAEANRFASELLMPTRWARELATTTSDPLSAARMIAAEADVSFHAATIKLSNILEPGYVFVQVRDGRVTSSGRSNGTIARAPVVSSTFSPGKMFGWAKCRWHEHRAGVEYFWWKLDAQLPQRQDSALGWREILDKIVAETDLDGVDPKTIKHSINGVIASANGKVKTARTAEAVYGAILQRLDAQDSAVIQRMRKHVSFNDFILGRIADLLERP
jgi:hypothetical protein